MVIKNLENKIKLVTIICSMFLLGCVLISISSIWTARSMVMRLNNIYSTGDYFFIDFSIDNKTNIRFDIDQIRMKLSDKKMSKATNAQSIEINPVMMLQQAKSFKYGYRNVLVIKKMTFPNDKVLTIEMAEKQISGRNIMLNIDYEDVLSADSFNASLLEEE